MPSVEKASKELKEIYAQMKEDNEEWFRKVDYAEQTLPVNNITLLSNPTKLYAKEPWVFYGLSRLMENSRKDATIHTPYIIFNEMMYHTFKEIVDEGEMDRLLAEEVPMKKKIQRFFIALLDPWIRFLL